MSVNRQSNAPETAGNLLQSQQNYQGSSLKRFGEYATISEVTGKLEKSKDGLVL